MAGQMQIVVPGLQSSYDDWRQAQDAPEPQLPLLDETEERAASQMRIPRDQYRRSKLALLLGHQRMEDKARQLGSFAEQELLPMDANARVVRVEWQSDRLRWLVGVVRGGREYGVPVPFEIANDALESKILGAEGQLRRALRTGVGLDAPEVTH